MTKNLKEYLKEQEDEATCCYRLKTVVPLDDVMMDKLELSLRKYNCYDITTPVKTIMQKNPRDFRDIPATEIYMVDFKTNYPAAPHDIRNELTKKLNIGEKQIIITNLTDPSNEEEPEDALVYNPIIGDDDYSEVSDVGNSTKFHGEEHKEKFIKDELKNRNKT